MTKKLLDEQQKLFDNLFLQYAAEARLHDLEQKLKSIEKKLSKCLDNNKKDFEP